MSNKTVFVRTSKGEAEASGQTALLFGEAKRVFMLVNNKSNVDELRKHAAPSLREIVEEVLEQLERDDFIRDKDATGQKKSPSSTSGGMAKIAMPKISVPEKPAKHEQSETSMGDDLDFSSIIQSPPIAPSPKAQPPAQETKPPVQSSSSTPAETSFGDDLDFSSLAQSVSKGGGADKPQEEPKSKTSAGPEIDFASILQSPGQGGGTGKAQAEAEAQKRAEVEAKMRAEAEAKKRAEAEARVRAEMEAKKRAEADAWARAELETKKKRAEAEAKARAEAETKSRNEVEAKIRAEMEARKRAEADAAVRARIEAEARVRAEAAAKARIEAEASAKARLEAEARAKAEAATRARIEAEARAKAEAAAKARIEAEAKARAEAEIRMRLEAEARARVEAENKMRLEAEARARAEAEATRKAAEDVDFSSFLTPTPGAGADNTMAEAEARARMEIEARMRAEEEAKVRVRSEQEAKIRAEEEAKARLRAELEAGIRPAPAAGIDRLLAVDPRLITGQHNAARSMIATVLFFDVVGYTKQSVAKQIELKGQFNSLISGLIGHVDEDQRIILDTGDGAAIGFLQHPEDALDVAMKFRSAVTANNHRNYPELIVRAGIHLGPVNVMKDMNGLLNMVGDGINDAQRIMSFAGMDQIYVSRAYFDVISRLTADSARLFKYNGTQKDKHGREHQVYQVLGEGTAAPAYGMPDKTGGMESLLQDLSSMLKEASGSEGQASAEWKPAGMARAPQAKTPQELEMEAKRAAQLKAEQAAEAARAKAQQEAADRARAEQEEAARKLAADQAKAFAEAEKRAQQQAHAESKAQELDPRLQARRPRSVKPPKPPRQRKPRRPLPLFKIVLTLIVLAAAGIVALPYVWPYIWPMQEVVAEVEKELSVQLKQPVHIGGLSTVSLPSPRMDLQDITVGNNKELTIRHIALHFNILTLPASIKEIEKAEVDDITISAPSFGGVLPWLQSMGANVHYPLAHISLHGLHISGDVPPLPPMSGTMEFDAKGKFTEARLRSDDSKITIKLQPHENRFNLDLSISDTSLPLLSKIQFSSLDATGEVGEGSINFPNITGNIYGGSLKGNANLSWKGGWQLQGHVNVSSMLVEKALPGLKITGEMDGDTAFSMSADKLQQLANSPRLDGSLRVKDGAINSMDLAETARSGDRQPSPGTTHFDLLSGTLHTDNSGHHLKLLKISAGAMSMNGSADAGLDGRLTGQLLVDLNKVRAGMGTISLVLNGTVSEPVWSIGKR